MYRLIGVKKNKGGERMAFCTKCGSKLKDGAMFCSNCGSPVKKANVKKQEVQEKQPNQTKDISEAPRNQQPVEMNKKQEEVQIQRSVDKKDVTDSSSSKSTKTIVVIACISIAIVLLIVGIVVFLKKNDGKISAEKTEVEESDDSSTDESELEKLNVFDYLDVDFEKVDGDIHLTWNYTGEYLSNEMFSAAKTDGIEEAEAIVIWVNLTDSELSEMGVIVEEKSKVYVCNVHLDEEDDDSNSMLEDYILPTSDSVKLTEEDLEGLTKEELRIARNEIYARKGRKFQDEELQKYFEGKEWYEGTIEPDDFSDSMLSKIETYNKDFIVAYEEKMGYR